MDRKVEIDKVLEIDLKQLLRLDLNINEWLTIYKIYENSNGNDIPFYTTNNSLGSLEDKGYIQTIEGIIYLKNKAVNLFEEDVINFDQLWDIYPDKTPSGRVLRAKNKEFLGALSKDYKILSKKYNSAVKNLSTHKKIIECTKNMISYHKNNGSSDYLLKLETYINQRGWERYVDTGSNENSFNMEKL